MDEFRQVGFRASETQPATSPEVFTLAPRAQVAGVRLAVLVGDFGSRLVASDPTGAGGQEPNESTGKSW